MGDQARAVPPQVEVSKVGSPWQKDTQKVVFFQARKEPGLPTPYLKTATAAGRAACRRRRGRLSRAGGY